MFKAQAKSGSNNTNANEHILDGWLSGVNGSSGAGWGRREDQKEVTGPEICWDHDGNVQPMALLDMTAEEKEVIFHREIIFESDD